MLINMGGTNRNRVVARFLDGRVIRGYALDFNPSCKVFHVRPTNAKGAAEHVAVRVSRLKALFFVKNLTTTSRTGSKMDPAQMKPLPSMRRVVVRFNDSEVLAGATCGYSPDRQGFFLVPLNPTTNNVRVFVVRSSVQAVRILDRDEDLAEVIEELEPDDFAKTCV